MELLAETANKANTKTKDAEVRRNATLTRNGRGTCVAHRVMERCVR